MVEARKGAQLALRRIHWNERQFVPWLPVMALSDPEFSRAIFAEPRISFVGPISKRSSLCVDVVYAFSHTSTAQGANQWFTGKHLLGREWQQGKANTVTAEGPYPSLALRSTGWLHTCKLGIEPCDTGANRWAKRSSWRPVMNQAERKSPDSPDLFLFAFPHELWLRWGCSDESCLFSGCCSSSFIAYKVFAILYLCSSFHFVTVPLTETFYRRRTDVKADKVTCLKLLRKSVVEQIIYPIPAPCLTQSCCLCYPLLLV